MFHNQKMPPGTGMLRGFNVLEMFEVFVLLLIMFKYVH